MKFCQRLIFHLKVGHQSKYTGREKEEMEGMKNKRREEKMGKENNTGSTSNMNG